MWCATWQRDAVNVNKRYIPSLHQLQHLLPDRFGKLNLLEEKRFARFANHTPAWEPRDHEALPNGVLAGCRDI